MRNVFEDDTVARPLQNASQPTMKVLIAALSIVATVSSLQKQYAPQYNQVGEDFGQYVADESGSYFPDDSGRYIPDNSGDYIPDGLGYYNPDGTGNYKGDGSGNYRGDGSGAFRNDKSRYQNVDNAGSTSFGGSAFNKPNRISTANLLGSGSAVDKAALGFSGDTDFENAFAARRGAREDFDGASSRSKDFGKVPQKYADIKYDPSRYADDGRWRIIRQDGDVDVDGYHWEYETENGITAEESGKVYNKGSEAEAMKAKGFFQYTGPDNVVYHITYTADENGFIPQGNHLPTPPPIPGLILKSLEIQQSSSGKFKQ